MCCPQVDHGKVRRSLSSHTVAHRVQRATFLTQRVDCEDDRTKIDSQTDRLTDCVLWKVFGTLEEMMTVVFSSSMYKIQYFY